MMEKMLVWFSIVIQLEWDLMMNENCRLLVERSRFVDLSAANGSMQD